MAILVIGNGFDLAHGLPTKYEHFLEFVKVFRAMNPITMTEDNEEDSISHDDLHNELYSFVYEFRCEQSKTFQEAFEIRKRENLLLEHFLSVYEELCKKGCGDWIDFESEIAKIVQAFDKALLELRNGEQISPKALDNIRSCLIVHHEGMPETSRIRINQEVLLERGQRLYNDLNDITRLLEIYLTEFVEKKKTGKQLPVIANLRNITGVISFNYTHTYQKLYGNDKTKYCYIHGQTKTDSSAESSNLVLGINEYLRDGRENDDNTFIWFKKFYQRIYKETDSTYIDWLDGHEHANEVMEKLKPTILDIFFYGHSLDITDKDVVSRLILHNNAQIYIYYRNKDDMAQKITNLVKVIGQENLIRMTRGEKRVIRFLEICENAEPKMDNLDV